MQTTSEEKGLSVEAGNRLIAEFVGYKFNNDNFKHYNITKPNEDDWFMASWHEEDIDNYVRLTLCYHSSWDLLIPACIKFKKLEQFSASMGSENYDPYYAERRMSLIYAAMTLEIKPLRDALIDGIQWHNQQSKS